MTHRLLAIVLGITSVAGSSVCAAPRIIPASRCADGACVPKRNTFGYHAGGWRKWPGEKASAGGVRPGTPKQAPLKDLPTVELPDPQHEDALDQPFLPPRSGEAELPAPTGVPKQSDPPPLPPIDPEDAPPGLPKTMRESDSKPKVPASPLEELFRDTPLPEPVPGQGAGSAHGAPVASMPLTIFRPSAMVRSDEGKSSEMQTQRAAKKPYSSKNESLPGRYMAGVFMAPDKLAKVSRTKKSDSKPRWANPLRAEAGVAEGEQVPSGFVAKVFAPPGRIDRLAPAIDKLNSSLPQGVEVQGSEPVLAKGAATKGTPQALPEEIQSDVTKLKPGRAMSSTERLSNKNPLRRSERTDTFVTPVSFETPSLTKKSNNPPQRSNPLR